MAGKWNYLRCSALTMLGGGVRGQVQEDTAFACLYKMLFQLAGTQRQRSRNIRKWDWVIVPSNPTSSTLEVSEQSRAFDCIWQWKLMNFIFQFIYKLVTFMAAFLFCYTIWLWWMKGGYFCCLVEINNINKCSFIPCITNETKPANRAKARFSSLT